MGKTYRSQKSFDDEQNGRSGKHKKHSNGRKTGGMRMLNSYVEEDFIYDDSPFDDDVEIEDSIQIQHTKHKQL